MKFNKDEETRELEKKALKIDRKETERLNSYYNSDFNSRTGDMSIYCYEYYLKKIIERGGEK